MESIKNTPSKTDKSTVNTPFGNSLSESTVVSFPSVERAEATSSSIKASDTTPAILQPTPIFSREVNNTIDIEELQRQSLQAISNNDTETVQRILTTGPRIATYSFLHPLFNKAVDLKNSSIMELLLAFIREFNSTIPYGRSAPDNRRIRFKICTEDALKIAAQESKSDFKVVDLLLDHKFSPETLVRISNESTLLERIAANKSVVNRLLAHFRYIYKNDSKLGLDIVLNKAAGSQCPTLVERLLEFGARVIAPFGLSHPSTIDRATQTYFRSLKDFNVHPTSPIALASKKRCEKVLLLLYKSVIDEHALEYSRALTLRGYLLGEINGFNAYQYESIMQDVYKEVTFALEKNPEDPELLQMKSDYEKTQAKLEEYKKHY
jgi:hypothetical protein